MAILPEGKGRLSSKALDIVINATDRSSKGIAGAKASFVGLAKSVSFATKAMLSLSGIGTEVALKSLKGILDITYKLTVSIGGLAGAFNSIQSLLSNPNVSPFLEMMSKELTEATTKAVKLSSITKAIAGSFVDLDKPSKQQAKNQANPKPKEGETSAKPVDQKNEDPKSFSDRALDFGKKLKKNVDSAVKTASSYAKAGADAGKAFGEQVLVSAEAAVSDPSGVIQKTSSLGKQISEKIAASASSEGLGEGEKKERFGGVVEYAKAGLRSGSSFAKGVKDRVSKELSSPGDLQKTGVELGKAVSSSASKQLTEINRSIADKTKELPKSVKDFADAGLQAGRGFAAKFSQAIGGSRLKEEAAKKIAGRAEDFTKAGQEAGAAFQKGVADQSTTAVPQEKAGDAGGLFGKAFAKSAISQIAPIADRIDGLIIGTVSKIKSLPGKIQMPLNVAMAPFGMLSDIDQPVKVLDAIKSGIGGFVGAVGKASQEIAFMGAALQEIKAFALGGPFQILIGQNTELQEQLLSTQASLAGTSKIFEGGIEIGDPTKAINALKQPVEKAIKDLRFESLELVGVTSKDLIPIYQQLAGSVTPLGGDLADAKDLTLDFAASLGTLSIPLFQARQEVGSIISGTIDMNSVLAKSLGITNDQVRNWKNQGKLIEELRKRLSAFRAGNAIAAQTIGGITSNIQEVFDEIGRTAGEQLLDPIVKELDRVYKFLFKNQERIAAYFTDLVGYALDALSSIARAGRVILGALGGFAQEVPVFLFKSLAGGAEAFAKAVEAAVPVLMPLVNVLTEVAKVAYATGGPFLEMFLKLKILQSGISFLTSNIGTFAKTVPVLGDVLFLLQGRTSEVVSQFTNLSQLLGGPGLSAVLVFGKNLNAIPGAADAIAKKLGPIGPIVVGFLPTIAGIGIQLGGLLALFPQLRKTLSNVIGIALTNSPKLLAQASALLKSTSFLGGALAPLAANLDTASAAVSRFSSASDIASFANSKLRETLISVLTTVAKKIAIYAALAGAAFLAFQAIDKFVLKNEQLLEVVGAITSGLGFFAQSIKSLFTNPITLAAIAVGALAIALKFKLIPAMLDVIKVQLASFALNAAGSLTVLSKILGALKLGSMATGAAQAAGGLSSLAAAAKAGTLSMSAFSASLAPIAAGLAAILAPLALAAAGIAAIGLVAYTKELKDSNETTEAFAEQTAVLSNEALTLASKLKKAKERQAESTKSGIKLSDEEYRRNELLQKQTAAFTQDTQAKLTELRAAQQKVVGQSNKDAIAQQITELESRLEMLQNMASGIEITPKDLPRLGGLYEQLSEKARGAEDAIKNPSGEAELFKQKAKELIEITQQQLELGQITAEEAERRIGLLTEEGRVATLDAESQMAARKAIAQVRETLDQNEARSSKNRTLTIEAEVARGEISESDSAKKITEIKLSELDSQLENLRDAKKKELEIQANSFKAETTELDKKIKEAEDRLALAEGRPDAVNAKASQALDSLRTQREGVVNQLKAAEQAVLDIQSRARPGKGLRASDKQALEAAKASVDTIKGQIEAVDQQIVDTKTAAASPKRDEAGIAQATKDLEGLSKKREELAEASARQTQQINEKYALEETEKTTEAEKLKSEERKKAIEKAAEEAQRVTKRAESERQIELQKLVNQGVLSQEEAESQRAGITQNRINSELKAEQDRLKALEANSKVETSEIKESKQKILDLTRQSLEQEKAVYEANIAKIKATIERSQREQQIVLQKGLNTGTITQEQAEEKKLEFAVQRLQKEIELETKNADKRKQLQLELLETEGQLQEAQLNSLRSVFEQKQRQLQIGLQKQINAGVITQTEAEEQKAALQVERLKGELELETRNANRRQEIQLQLLEAERQLQEAAIATYGENIRDEAKAFGNEIERQTMGLERQTQLYDSLSKALENRNKLLEAGKSLAEATSNFVTSELNAIAEGERSEFRRRQIAELTASIKLEALRKQQEFERQIFEIQQQQNKIALEREATENRIAILKQQAEIKAGQAEVAVAQREFEIGKISQAELDSVKIQQEAKVLQLDALQQQSALIKQQQDLAPKLEAFERRKLDLQQDGAETAARIELAKSLGPGRSKRALDTISKEAMARTFGTDSRGDFYSQLRSRTQAVAEKEFGAGAAGGSVISAYDPELDGLSSVLSRDQMRSAIADTQRNFTKAIGPAATAGAFLPGASGAPALQIPGIADLTLASDRLKEAAFANQSGFMEGKVPDKLDELKDVLASQKNYSISVTVPVTGGGDKKVGQEFAKKTEDALMKVLKQADTLSRR